MTSEASALARLVGDAHVFLAEHFGRAPLHVRGADPDGFADLLALDDVDHLVAATGLRAPGFRMVRDGRTLPRGELTRRVRIGSRPVDDLVDVAAVHAAFADGATLVLQGLHRSWAPVTDLCRALELTLTHPTQANAYLTPPVAQGLHLHADPHDVFAVQTHGVKRWVVHPPDGADPWDLELVPGDVLYLPAGTRHAAQTVDRPSLHLTVGVRTVRWRDLVRRAMADLLDDPELAVPLPAGWADDPEALANELRSRVGVLGSAMAEGFAATGVCAAEAAAFHAGRTVDRTGGLRDLLDLAALGDTTWLRRRAGSVCHVAAGDSHLELTLADRGLRLPLALADSIGRILEHDRFRPRDLDDLLDEPSRLVLCRRLVREGLLTIDHGGDDGRGAGG